MNRIPRHRSLIAGRAPRRGFTMIELMVTVAIAAILLALAAPAMKNVLTSRAVAAQSSELLEGLHFARSEAMKRSMPVTICKVTQAAPTTCSTVAGTTWQNWLIFVDPNGSGTIGVYDAGETILRQQYQASGNVDWQPATPVDLNYVRFQSTGIAVANSWGSPGTNGANRVTFTVYPKMSGAGTGPFNRAVRQVCLNAQGRADLIDGNAACT